MNRENKREKNFSGHVKRAAVVGLAGCLLAGGSMQVCAATLKDVFDEHYYADTYEDLKAVYGYDREALWNHFVTYGLKEGRNMNGLLDVVKYRAEYEDLDKAFGNNWDAYLNHYLVYGAKEERNTGTDFDALDYAGRYEDLQKAFGENVLSLWRHYQDFGKTENREARDEEVVEAEKKASQQKTDQGDQNQGTIERLDRTDGSGGVAIFEWDSSERKFVKKITWCRADGSVEWIEERDGQGNRIKSIGYNADGSFMASYEYEFTFENRSDGQHVKTIEYNADGSIKWIYKFENDGAEQRYVKQTLCHADGSVVWVTEYEYNSNGQNIKTTERYASGRVESVTEYEYNADGSVKSVTKYDADGNVIESGTPN